MNTNGILDLCRKTQSQTEILKDEGLTELAVYSYTHSYTHTLTYTHLKTNLTYACMMPADVLWKTYQSRVEL